MVRAARGDVCCMQHAFGQLVAEGVPRIAMSGKGRVRSVHFRSGPVAALVARRRLMATNVRCSGERVMPVKLQRAPGTLESLIRVAHQAKLLPGPTTRNGIGIEGKKKKGETNTTQQHLHSNHYGLDALKYRSSCNSHIKSSILHSRVICPPMTSFVCVSTPCH
ncbi:hypothetical protein K504DRAFT_126062 [Pleomassaria siparia CBS 279.74]|uniref:Uncharacterized protein n=1 Tax=Pleomassaria siparia CBS 279.74 TaxID=1314801 RepID=A0A6G1KJD1_9PLEO|nr:hypothetical protein K504DRAFT_126062 [Pleomassaria siparia CBS 279.74]